MTYWPEADQELWQDACGGRGTWELDNPACRWSVSWRKMIEGGYGRFIGWLARHDGLDAAWPEQRILPDTITRFTNSLAASGLASTSIANLARTLRAYASAIDPEGDWQWLAHRAFRLKKRAVPSRDKALRVVHSSELYTLGLHLMNNSASAKNQKSVAAQFRDGLMISLLALRPLRLSNFEAIALGSTLLSDGSTYWLSFSEQETKTGRPIRLPTPVALNVYVDEYLRIHRKTLLSLQWAPAAPTTSLWISDKGLSSSSEQIRAAIKSRTKLSLGRSINPHLFRDCLATTMATDDPAGILCIVPILGHASFKTVEQNYNHATMLTATRDFASEIMQYRNEMLSLFGLDDVLSFLHKAESGQELTS